MTGDEQWTEKFHENARRVQANTGDGTGYVYASFSRPISLIWASIPGEPVLIHSDYTNWPEAIPHTWVVTRQPLADDVTYRYELTAVRERVLCSWCGEPFTPADDESYCSEECKEAGMVIDIIELLGRNRGILFQENE